MLPIFGVEGPVVAFYRNRFLTRDIKTLLYNLVGRVGNAPT